MKAALDFQTRALRAMSAASLVGLFVAPLNRAGIEYMVTGGLLRGGDPDLEFGLPTDARAPRPERPLG